jgi:hypothetical protein
MGYVKETINSVELIRLYYKTDDLFNKASEITTFKASSVRLPDGQADFNRLQISGDEKNHIKEYIRDGLLEIFGKMFKMLGAGSSTDTMFFDASITVAAVTFNAYGGFIVDNSTGSSVQQYREVNLALMDSKIAKALVYYILVEWYWLKNMAEDSKMNQIQFDKLLVDITDLTLSLRKPRV